jgi:hypothetical protein
MAPTPRVRVDVLRFDQAQADQSPVLIHALDRVTGQLQLADHSRWGVKPSRAQRGQGHRLLTSTTQQLKRQTMLGLNERHGRIINNSGHASNCQELWIDRMRNIRRRPSRPALWPRRP